MLKSYVQTHNQALDMVMRHQNTVRVRRTSEHATHSADRKTTILVGIDESVQRLNARDAEFFAKSLPKSEHWRVYNDFNDRIAFVDIETTGLSPHYNRLTVVGIHDGTNVKTFVRGIDLDRTATPDAGARIRTNTPDIRKLGSGKGISNQRLQSHLSTMVA